MDHEKLQHRPDENRHGVKGIPCAELGVISPPRKGIICSCSFGMLTESLTDLKQATATYTARAAKKMRYQKLAARESTVFITTNRFREWEPQYQYHKAGVMLLNLIAASEVQTNLFDQQDRTKNQS